MVWGEGSNCTGVKSPKGSSLGVVVLEKCLIVILPDFVSPSKNIGQFIGRTVKQPVVVGAH